MEGQWIQGLEVRLQGSDDGRYLAAPEVTDIYLDGESVLATIGMGAIETRDDTALVSMQFTRVDFFDGRGRLQRKSLGSSALGTHQHYTWLGWNRVRNLHIERWGLDGLASGWVNMCFWGNVY